MNQEYTYNTEQEVVALKSPNTTNWKELVKTEKLSEQFILENADFLDWNLVSANQKLTAQILVLHASKVKWKKLEENPHISEDLNLISQYKGNMKKLINKEQLSDDFLERNAGLLDWNLVSSTQKLPENLVLKYIDRVNIKEILRCGVSYSEKLAKELITRFKGDEAELWEIISTYGNFPESFFREFENKVIWEYLGAYQQFSEQFIKDYQYLLESYRIHNHQKKHLSKEFLSTYPHKSLENLYKEMTEEFIEDYPHPNRLNWQFISRHTKLSEAFIERYWDKLHLNTLFDFHKFSETFIQKQENQIDDAL